MRLLYRDDLHGYDDLFTFADIFPSYAVWEEKLNGYLYYNQVGDLDKSEIIYNNLIDIYKGNFFRFSMHGKIYNQVASRLETLYEDIKAAETIGENREGLAGQTTVTNRFRTANEVEGELNNDNNYRTSGDETFVDNGAMVIELLQAGVAGRNRVNRFIDEFRTLFMNHTNEVMLGVGYDK